MFVARIRETGTNAECRDHRILKLIQRARHPRKRILESLQRKVKHSETSTLVSI